MKITTMKAIRLLLAVLPLSFLLGLTGCNSSSGGEDATLHIMTEDYYPYNYQEDGVAKGLSYEVVQQIMAQEGRTDPIEFSDWDQAITALENDDNAVLFTTTLTPERKDKFKWVGPLDRITWALFSTNGRLSTLDSLQESFPYRVAVTQNYPAHEYLVSAGHPNLVVFPTEDEALAAFFQNQVDLVATSNPILNHYATIHNHRTSNIHKIYDLKTELLYIAFSKGTSDSIVNGWQQRLDSMKTDRSFSGIYQKYLPNETIPEILQLFTEQYPPITFQDKQGNISGGATEMVRQILSKLNIPDNTILTNWDNAYNLATLNPRVVLFSTERTSQREDLFNWVGPIGRNSANFYTKAGSSVVIDSLEGAKSLRAIGTCSSWFTEQLLKGEGFTNLVSVPTPDRLVQMLMNGEIDATVFTDVTLNDVVSSAGYTVEQLSKQYLLTSTDFYIAISKGTESDIVSNWQSALDEMVSDGTFGALYSQWYPNAENPYQDK